MSEITKCAITKCANGGCPNKEKCFRFTAPEDPHWQSWSHFVPDYETGECDDFIKDDLTSEEM